MIRGAKATATICWWSKKRGGWRGASIDGRIYDTRSDGKYAAFKIHWRSRKGRPWKSHTRVLETTEGDYAPTSTRVKSYREKWYPIKDLWIKACRSDGACDRYWR
ncbi:hypothetical protein CDO52_14780 [Nocardiopsis gilva YIM 90087]|uniref:Uncharacterized protein n=1 Tax=Nocardiopsis gilva YIM 90087 TaxID=1235441 RepID=A0A223S6X9_9ACTN|nr:hypothetical protein CDO52_14780 [Nocardiopsis gilva YIM 90087]